ncbi:trypsin iota [Drosophila ficusphila]|uniref:trypsin iota n=1 Tax=Drosophila ficusphila TaxID=30025 RepID=UPI0007E7E64D|nr:trypsin iota [Drosophila ficusphila]
MLFKSFLLVVSLSAIQSQDLLDVLPVRIGDVPWQAMIKVDDEYRCGGVIYKEDIVLTIIECVNGVYINNISVRVGSAFKNLGGTEVKVKTVRLPLSDERQYNVAVLQLDSNLQLGGSINTIELANRAPATGAKVSVSGWGQLTTFMPSSEVLLRINLFVQDKKKCSEDEICAAPWGLIPAACQGFAGCPLVHNNDLVGIGSWNNTCSLANTPSRYVDIALIRPWIDATVGLLRGF